MSFLWRRGFEFVFTFFLDFFVRDADDEITARNVF